MPVDPPSFVVLPAVDVADGRAVRQVRGEVGSETRYGAPLDAALAWQAGGAAWVHLVDLDAAFERGSNHDLIAEVAGRLDVAVELSGGIRDDDSLTAALATGCAGQYRYGSVGTARLGARRDRAARRTGRDRARRPGTTLSAAA